MNLGNRSAIIDRHPENTSSNFNIEDNPDQEGNDKQKNLNYVLNKKFKICIYKPLIPLKLVLFFYYGGASILAPFITVYFKQRGISLSELSMVMIISPIAQFLGALTSGIIADKTGKSKTILVFNLVFQILFLVSILLIPPLNSSTSEFPAINLKCHLKQFDKLKTSISCVGLGNIIQIKFDNVDCPEKVIEHYNGQNLTCEILQDKTKTSCDALENIIQIIFCNNKYLENLTKSCNGNDLNCEVLLDSKNSSCDILENNIEIHFCNSQCPENVTEFCNGQNLTCVTLLDKAITSCDVLKNIIPVKFGNVPCPENVTEHSNEQNFICEVFAGQENNRNFSLPILVKGSLQSRDRCYFNLSYSSYENRTISWCDIPHKVDCGGSSKVNSKLKCSEETSSRDMLMIVNMVFYILLLVTYSNCYRILDVTAMNLVKEHNSHYGRERFFSIAGILVISPLAGYIAQLTTPTGGEKNYMAALCLYIAILILVLIFVYRLDVTIKSPGKNMAHKTFQLLKNPDVLSFALVVLVLGTAWSFTKVFLFWYLEEMKSPSILIGLIPSVGALYGLPFLLTSKWWVVKIGTKQIFIIGLLAYVVNLTGYSYLKDPWLSMLLEATNIFTYHLLWVAVIMHSHDLAPEGLVASVISMAGSLHYQIGKSIGSMIGGFTMNTFGGRAAFRVLAVMCLTCAVIYASYLLIRHKFFNKKNRNVSKEPEDK